MKGAIILKITNIHQSMTEADFLKKINRENTFVPPQKGDAQIAASLQISDEAQKRFEAEIQHFDRRIAVPVYSGIYQTDKTIASAVEGCSREEQIFVYDIIGQNFLKGNTSSLSEEERQANIALGMKKAEYAAQNFIPETNREKFLDAMKNIAKIASAGKADKNGNMDYGITKASYLGHGNGLVATTDTLDVMKHMDSAAYEEYQRIRAESNDEESMFKAFRYLLDWYERSVKKLPPKRLSLPV